MRFRATGVSSALLLLESVLGPFERRQLRLCRRTACPSVAAGVFVGRRRLPGPYTVRWVMNGMVTVPWFQPACATAAKSRRAHGKKPAAPYLRGGRRRRTAQFLPERATFTFYSLWYQRPFVAPERAWGLSLDEPALAAVHYDFMVAGVAPCVMPYFRCCWPRGLAGSSVPCCRGAGDPCAFAAHWLCWPGSAVGLRVRSFSLWSCPLGTW